MLNTIKSIINQKKAYLESAELLLEDAELDDSIVLDESPMEIPPAENTEEQPEAPEENIGAEEQPLPMEGDELPTPAAEPTGEPVSDDSVDIMTAEIDLATNTQTDILPVPPANANDAIDGEDDIMSQTVDSGFGGDEDKAPIETTTDIMSEPIDEPEVQADDNKEKENLDVNTPVGESGDEPSEDDDVMNEAVDDNKIEKSIEEKEKEYLKSYKESGDIMDAPIDEAVDDNKIEKSIEEKEKEYNKSYKEDGNETSDSNSASAEPETSTENSAEATTESTENGEVMTEAISLGDDASGDAGTDVSADASTEVPDETAAPAEDNAVTAAVKDKVDELASTDSIDSGSSITDKEELMKKLSALTKSIEDAKSLVLKGLQ